MSSPNYDMLMVFEDHQPKSKNQVFVVYWFDERADRKNEVPIKVCSDVIIKDFLQMVIGEFNQYFRRNQIDEFFMCSEYILYELFMPEYLEIDDQRYVTGRPDEEFPCYDENQKLKKTNATEFALKITNETQPDLWVSNMSDPKSGQQSPHSEEEKQIVHYTDLPYPYHSINRKESTSFVKTDTSAQSFTEPKKPKYSFCCYAHDDD